MTIGIGGTGRLFSILGRTALVLAVVGGLACRQKAPAPTENKQTKPAVVEPNKAPATAEAEKPAVTVNGQVVTEKLVADRLAVAMKQYGSRLANLPPQFAEQMQKQMKGQILDRLVLERLLDEQVKAGHLEATEQDAMAEIEKTVARQQPPMTVADFQARVEAQGGNFQDVKDEFRRGIGYRKVLEGQWAGKADVTDEQAKQYYDANPKQFEQPEQIRASHILILTRPTDPNSDPNKVKAAAKEKTQKLLSQIKAGGDFAALAKDNSQDPGSAAQGGDLGFFPREAMVKEFEDAAWALQKDQVSDLVETQYGYHIIKMTDHKDASKTTFDEAKAGIVDDLSGEKKNAITKDYLQSLKDKAKIVYAPGNEPEPPQPAPQPAASGQPAPQPEGTKPAQPAAQPAPQTPPAQATPQPTQPATQPAQPAAQPAPKTGTAEPNAAKVAPR
jgi:peptidyl-prolyl cis-trans isomerase C